MFRGLISGIALTLLVAAGVFFAVHTTNAQSQDDPVWHDASATTVAATTTNDTTSTDSMLSVEVVSLVVVAATVVAEASCQTGSSWLWALVVCTAKKTPAATNNVRAIPLIRPLNINHDPYLTVF